MPKPKQLFVLSVRFKNILGLRQGGIDPQGRAVEFSGPNESGKTSQLHALLAGLLPGSLRELKNVHTDEDPEVVIELGGAGQHFRIEKKGGDTARVLQRVGDTQAFDEVRRPQEFLSGLFDTKCSNPAAFLLAPEKEQATLLLQALPLQLDRQRLHALLGEHLKHVTNRELIERANLHPLEEVQAYRDALYEARRGVNHDKDAKRKAAEQAKRNLPAVLPEDPADAIDERQAAVEKLAAEVARETEQANSAAAAALQEAQSKHDVEGEQITGAFKLEREVKRKAHDERATAMRAELERQIADLHRKNEAEIEERRAKAEGRLDELDEQLEQATAAAGAAKDLALQRVEFTAGQLAAAREELAVLRERADSFATTRARLEDAQAYEAGADELQLDSEALTDKLDAIDTYRRQMADDLPIKGLSIAGKEIRLDGVLWKQLNAAKKAEIAAKVAMLRAADNPLKLIFLDDLEKLDTPNRTALIETLLEHGMQPVGARVTDGDPEVRYIGAVTDLKGSDGEPEPEPVGAGAGKSSVLPMPTRGRRRLE